MGWHLVAVCTITATETCLKKQNGSSWLDVSAVKVGGLKKTGKMQTCCCFLCVCSFYRDMTTCRMTFWCQLFTRGPAEMRAC